MEERQVALPKLYGAPAYRPPRRTVESEKPFDPDDLPITSTQTDEEREFVEALPPEAFAAGGGVVLGAEDADDAAQQPERRGGIRALSRLLTRD